MTLLAVWDDQDPTAPVVQTRDDSEITELLGGLDVRFSRWSLKELPEDATPIR